MTAVSIHPGLAESPLRDRIRPDRPRWTPAELRHLTSTVAVDLAVPLSRLLRYDHDHRWWARLALTDGVELWLLSWLPGQGTGAHDHGGASGSFAVLTGELTERFRYPAGPARAVARAAGDVVGFGADRVHDVRNDGATPAASVHAYSPPLLPTRHFPDLLVSPDQLSSPHQLHSARQLHSPDQLDLPDRLHSPHQLDSPDQLHSPDQLGSPAVPA